MIGPRPRCRLLRELPVEDRLLLAPELRELRRAHPPDRLRGVLRETLEDLRRERGVRSLESVQIDLDLLRRQLENRLEGTAI